MASLSNLIVRQMYLARGFLRTVWRGRSLNPFVYEECQRLKLEMPDIPVPAIPYYGQLAEDRLVLGLLDAIAFNKGVKLEDLTYVEVGANHPVACSGTYLLATLRGMRGILVEANENLLPALRAVRANDKIVYAAVQTTDAETVNFSVSNLNELSSVDRNFVQEWDKGSVGEAALKSVPATRMDKVLAMAPHQIAYLSIDVEGLDLDLLKDTDFSRFRPWLVQAEPSDHYIAGNTETIVAHMASVGYEMVARTDYNLIFRDRQL